MENRRYFVDFILREWLLFASFAGLLTTSIYLKRVPPYSKDEFEVLFILAVLFVIVKGLETSGFLAWISGRLQKGRLLSLKLVMATFLLSMVVTNDVSLVVIVPITLLMDIPQKGILVILEALAANAGSALTPFGNPQNLFIYWHYQVAPWEFVKEIAPLSLLFLVLLAVAVLCFVKMEEESNAQTAGTVAVEKGAFLYGAFLVVMVLAVLHLISIWIGVAVLAYTLLFDRRSLKIDYLLLLTFVCFFGLAENFKVLLSSNINHPQNIFLFSALVSQVISNVPAALLFANFTVKWKALLWGTNVGGFGSLVGSLANLIAYKLYVSNGEGGDMGDFTLMFLVFGYVSFFIGVGLYLLLY